MLPHNVPQVLINLESLPHANRFDVQLLGHCDEIVQELCRRLSWDLNISLGAHTTTEIERVDDNSKITNFEAMRCSSSTPLRYPSFPFFNSPCRISLQKC